MNRKSEIFEQVLTSPFDNDTFVGFVKEFLNNIQLVAPTNYNKEYSNPDVIEDYYNTQSMSSKPFILWQLYFPRVFRDNGGFDIVIGNPPYGSIF